MSVSPVSVSPAGPAQATAERGGTTSHLSFDQSRHTSVLTSHVTMLRADHRLEGRAAAPSSARGAGSRRLRSTHGLACLSLGSGFSV